MKSGALTPAWLLALAGCAGTPPPSDLGGELARAESERASGDTAAAEKRLNGILAETESEREAHALERFHAAEALARLHTELSLRAASAPPEPGGEDVRAIPASSPAEPGSELVAVVYHASQALAEREQAQRAEGPGTSGERGVADSCAGLELLLACSYTRLGFRDAASSVLAGHSELFRTRNALRRFSEVALPSPCWPWACDALSELLRARDELEAYRFAVLALEGGTRFEHELPPAEQERLEDWIQAGASVRFVCPKSQTPWMRGMTRSPISGVPHLDYVAIERAH